MKSISFALLSDGSSDAALLLWVLREHAEAQVGFHPQWADLRRLGRPPDTLALRIAAAAQIYRPDLLFIHRDAEGEPAQDRHAEIAAAIEQAKEQRFNLSYLAVVPIRMQEAWLLVDEAAIRRAAGNPFGKCHLDLPALKQVESLPDPKAILHQALRQACSLHGRRLRKFNVGKATHRVAGYTTSFETLRRLSAFQRLESDVEQFLRNAGVTKDAQGAPRTIS